MASVFTRIIEGELPGRFVWRDEQVVAFLSINPITPGHSLIVPRVEVDHWLDLDPAVWQRCSEVALEVGKAIQRVFDPPRVGQAIAGFEVPHTHIHVLQLNDLSDLSFEKAQADPDQAMMDDAAERLRSALRDAGHTEHASA
jgi:diadenosine tetraphosphate (Ap4A) HIT family hydrolase